MDAAHRNTPWHSTAHPVSSLPCALLFVFSLLAYPQKAQYTKKDCNFERKYKKIVMWKRLHLVACWCDPNSTLKRRFCTFSVVKTLNQPGHLVCAVGRGVCKQTHASQQQHTCVLLKNNTMYVEAGRKRWRGGGLKKFVKFVSTLFGGEGRGREEEEEEQQIGGGSGKWVGWGWTHP